MKSLFLIITAWMIALAHNHGQTSPAIGNSPMHIEYKDGIPISAKGFPPDTEIKDPYSARKWIVQADGTLKPASSPVKTSTAESEDPIGRLAVELSKNPLWQNGAFPVISLPMTAKPEDIIKECFKMTGFGRGHVTDYEIKEIKNIVIRGSYPNDYMAARCETDLGGKIVLFRYQPPNWWTRVYDARYYYMNKK